VITDWGSPEETRAAMTRKIKQDLTAYWNNLDNPEVKREAAKDPVIKGWMETYQIPYLIPI